MLTIPAEDEAELVDRLREAGNAFAEEDVRFLLSASTSESQLREFVQRRCLGEPIEQITGWFDFFGLRLAIEPGVEIPGLQERALVREAIARTRAGSTVVELGCESGAVGIAICSSTASAELYATESDPAAANCAARNFARFGGKLLQGDSISDLPEYLRGEIDILIASSVFELNREVTLPGWTAPIDLEPRPSGSNSLIDEFFSEAAFWLAPGGHLLAAVDEALVDAVTQSAQSLGLRIQFANSEDTAARILIGQRTAG